MNYFTPKWHSGDLDDADSNVSEQYEKHLDGSLPRWPPDVQTLASRISLHDGLIRKLSWNTDEATLFLRLRCGDLQVGYFDLDLHYSGVLFSPTDLESLVTLKSGKVGEALYDEMDEEDGYFVHRILFLLNRRGRSPRRTNACRRTKLPLRCAKRKFQYREIIIRFEELDLVMTPCESRFDASRSVGAGGVPGL